jgi:hypothetical protein
MTNGFSNVNTVAACICAKSKKASAQINNPYHYQFKGAYTIVPTIGIC